MADLTAKNEKVEAEYDEVGIIIRCIYFMAYLGQLLSNYFAEFDVLMNRIGILSWSVL